ncbi:glycosyltransferase [Pseudomonadales bacterium]|nr:glycosyltransferase [Pseudomonadales bacterium]
MRAIFVLVNYNADGKVCEFLESLACIALLESTDRIDVLIVDNSEKNLSARTEFCEKTSGYEGLNIEWIFEETNSGYFGPLAKVQKYIEGNDYQWVIYSNPDLLLDSKFLANLQRANDLHNGDLVAPSIIDGKSGGDQNPQYRLRPSKFKLRFLRALFSSNLFFNIYQNLGYLKQSLNHSLKELGFTASRAKITEGAASIYAGHGSLFIFKGCETFLALPKYPCFLFLEELFVAEEVASAGSRIVFVPTVKAYHTNSFSIGTLHKDQIRRYYLASLDYVTRTYFR